MGDLLKVVEEYYDQCAWDNVPAFSDFQLFSKCVKDMFPKGIALKETSEYVGVLKNKKDKKKSGDENKVKMYEVVIQTLEHLKNHAMVTWPALQLHVSDKKFLTALDQLERSYKVYLVKGVGRCCYYRLTECYKEKKGSSGK